MAIGDAVACLSASSEVSFNEEAAETEMIDCSELLDETLGEIIVAREHGSRFW
jgi:hypothetical protein